MLRSRLLKASAGSRCGDKTMTGTPDVSDKTTPQ
jgi:hypothetical protein